MGLGNRRDAAGDGGWFVGCGQTSDIERHRLRLRREGWLRMHPAPRLEMRPVGLVRPDRVPRLGLIGEFRGAVGDGGEWAYFGGAVAKFGGHRETGLAEP